MAAINDDLARWDNGIKPWFRGESDDQSPLCPKIAEYDRNEENYLLQSFRRKAVRRSYHSVMVCQLPVIYGKA